MADLASGWRSSSTSWSFTGDGGGDEHPSRPGRDLHRQTPHRDARHDEPGDTGPSHAARRGVRLSLEGVRALVVEDDADGSFLLREMLAGRGAEVRTASSVAEAFEILKSWRPTVLLADIEMPGEDGYALMRRLRSLPPDQGGTIPAMAVTAYGRMEDRIASSPPATRCTR